jgi:hypothetical protein
MGVRDNLDRPASVRELDTKLEALRDTLVETMRDMQTELLRAFADYSGAHNIRFRKMEADLSNVNTSTS